MDSIEQKHIEGIRAGDPSTFQVIFCEYYPALTVFAQKFVSDHDLSKEIVQDMYVQLYEKRQSLTIETSLKSYLFQSVRNSCLNRIRQEKMHGKHHEEIKRTAPGDTGLTDLMAEVELEQKIFEIISGLPPKCKQIFLMSRQEELSNREIADRLDISIRTVETQVSKALKTFRENLDL